LSLEPYDVVFAYLSPVPMADLWDKVQREMRPGTLFVSCAFEVPGRRPDRIIELSSPRQPRLLVWQIPASK
jgi:transposase